MDNFKEEMGFLNAPQFPGQQVNKGATIDAIRSMIKRQKRLKGYDFSCPVGTSTFDLNLSGTARILLGIALYGRTFDAETGEYLKTECCTTFTNIETVQFTVNNEIVIDTLDPNFLSFGFNNNEYYYIPRPLSGTDILTLKFQNNGTLAEQCKVVLYYI
jgi:hypothetical protein